jgi:hypothetical protein
MEETSLPAAGRVIDNIKALLHTPSRLLYFESDVGLQILELIVIILTHNNFEMFEDRMLGPINNAHSLVEV